MRTAWYEIKRADDRNRVTCVRLSTGLVSRSLSERSAGFSMAKKGPRRERLGRGSS